MLGTAVEPDPSSSVDPQEVRQVTGGGTPDNSLGGTAITGIMGVLWYEHDSQSYVGASWDTLVQDYNTAPVGRMVQVLSGRGAKVWFRNTDASTTEPGLNFPNTRAEVVMVANLGHDGTGDIAVNDLLAWDDTNGYWAETAVLAEAFMRVTYADNTLEVCDAEFLL